MAAKVLKYCKVSTCNHGVAKTFSSCLIALDSLLLREGFSGPIPCFDKGEIVVDMDLVEEKIAQQEQRLEKNKSMDLAFVIKTEDDSKVACLLVELKLNMLSFYNLDRVQLEEKARHSVAVLGDVPPIYGRFYFVVNTGGIQEATRRIFNMRPEIDRRYCAIDVPSLKETYFG